MPDAIPAPELEPGTNCLDSNETGQVKKKRGAFMNRRNDFHTLPDWENPRVTAINRWPAHSPWGAYSDEESALAGDSFLYQLCLNGEYEFRLCSCPEEAGDFWKEEASAFQKIQVPGAWELQGFGKPVYTNVHYPWSYEEDGCTVRPWKQADGTEGGLRLPDPPHLPKDNPTGLYRRTFSLPEEFEGKEIFLRFEGVETAFYLWVNGRPAGYSQDSKLPCEFKVTGFLRPGENQIALQVMRFADSSYLEDQDYWHLSGIHRDVWLIAKPACFIQDLRVQADLLPEKKGKVTVEASVCTADGYGEYELRFTLYGPDGKAVGTKTASPAVEALYRSDVQPTRGCARAEFSLEAECWSPENPVLYRAVAVLRAPGGETDFEAASFGFKRIENRDGVLYLNGTRLLIRGVNRHEFCCTGGRTVDESRMREEIRQMKRMNINAVRTCHYPDCPLWYDLCDELGLLVLCECNLETHGVSGLLSHDPEWAGAYLERAVRMAQTYKNHVCIYGWSLGNESGAGPNHAAMYGFLKEYDPARLCQYESGSPGENISDVRGDMYATPEAILRLLCDPKDRRPVILVEYLYQIRNSGGGMDRFLELTERYPRFQGGFVWDWQDKAILARDREGNPFFAHGGDFGEPVLEPENPPFMVNNGLVLADPRWKPAAYEVQAAYCPIRIERPRTDSAWSTLPPEGIYVVKNRCLTLRTNAFTCEAVLFEDGEETSRWDVELPDLAPMEEAEIEVSLFKKLLPGKEYHLNFVIRRREAWFSDAGDDAGCFQFPLRNIGTQKEGKALLPGPAESRRAPAVLTEEPKCWQVSWEGGRAEFSKRRPLFTLYGQKTSVQLLAVPCLDRPYCGLDAVEGWGWREEFDRVRGLTCTFAPARALSGGECARIEYPFAFGRELFGTLAFTVDGGISVDFSFTAGAYILPRVGIEWTLPGGFEDLVWFGRDGESYPDRKLGCPVRICRSTVEEQHFPFCPPSECGGHEDTRWLTLSEGRTSLRFSSDTPFHFDARHISVESYRRAMHDGELLADPVTYLHTDAAHGPIGGCMAWSTFLPEAQRLSEGRYTLSLRIEME